MIVAVSRYWVQSDGSALLRLYARIVSRLRLNDLDACSDDDD